MDFDAFLRAERLAIDDPYDQDGLLPRERVPRSALKVVFDNFYYSRAEKIYCHVCGGHRHKKGITGLFDNGHRILFGSSCAKDYFGPEIAKLCAADLRRRTSNARSRYKVLVFRNSTDGIIEWTNSYRNLIHKCQETWVSIRDRHSESFDEITSHLSKNGGRVLETSVEKLRTPDGRSEFIQNHKILTFVRRPDAIPYLTQINQQLSLVDVFVESAHKISQLDDDALIRRMAGMFNEMSKAASRIDSALEFSADFLSPPKLDLIGQWLDDRRRERLRDRQQLTPRDTAKLFSRIAGVGFTGPPKSLSTLVAESGVSQQLKLNADNTAEQKTASQE